MTTAEEAKKQTKKRIAENEAEDGFRISTGQTIFFDDYKQINPALDFTEDTMFIVSPFPYLRDHKDKDGNVIGTYRDIDNFAVLSSRLILKLYESYFTERKLIPWIPGDTLDQRWSKASIRAFVNEKIDADPSQVFTSLKDTWDNFIDFGNNRGAYTANSLYNILTYCYPLFSSVPYLRFTGIKGSAKSKAGDIHALIDFNAFKSVDLTPAILFRTIQDTRGTTIIDEAEVYGGNTKSEKQQANDAVINSGFQPSGRVFRIEMPGRKKVSFSTYGPKIVCGIHTVTETLRDRSFEILLIKTLNKERSSRAVRQNDPRWQKIRDSLYVMMLNHWKEIREIVENGEFENRLNLIGRDWDKAFPLLVLAHFVAKYDREHGDGIINDTWAFLEDQKNKESELQLESFDKSIIEELEIQIKSNLTDNGMTILEDAEVNITLRDFAEKIAEVEGKNKSKNYSIRSYSKSVKGILEKLNLAHDFKNGTGNFTEFTTSLKQVKEARERYKIPKSTDENEKSINSINLTNLFNSINFINSQLSNSDFDKLIRLKDENLINSLRTSNIKPELIKLIKLIENEEEKGDQRDPSDNKNLQSYIVCKQFYDSGLVYSEGQTYNWDSESTSVKKWLREEKIAQFKEGDPR